MSENREPSSATTSSRQNSEPPGTELAIRTYSGLSSSTPRGTRTSSPCRHEAALWAVSLSSAPTSEPSSSCSVSGSNVTPSGTRSISIPPSLTDASPATSRSSMRSARTTEVAPLAVNASGSKPLRSVNRHASSVVEGSARSR